MAIGYDRVNVNGVLDEKTKAAINEFKRERGFVADGVVDFPVFVLLRTEYKKRPAKDSLLHNLNLSQLAPGSVGGGALIFNQAVSEILDYMGIDHGVRARSFLTADTMDAADELRKVFGMEQIGGIDEELIGRISKEYRSILEIKSMLMSKSGSERP